MLFTAWSPCKWLDRALPVPTKALKTFQRRRESDRGKKRRSALQPSEFMRMTGRGCPAKIGACHRRALSTEQQDDAARGFPSQLRNSHRRKLQFPEELLLHKKPFMHTRNMHEHETKSVPNAQLSMSKDVIIPVTEMPLAQLAYCQHQLTSSTTSSSGPSYLNQQFAPQGCNLRLASHRNRTRRGGDRDPTLVMAQASLEAEDPAISSLLHSRVCVSHTASVFL